MDKDIYASQGGWMADWRDTGKWLFDRLEIQVHTLQPPLFHAFVSIYPGKMRASAKNRFHI